MKIILTLPPRKARKEFKIDRRFKTRSMVTERTLAVAEAFGIGVDEEKEFVVYRDFAVDIQPGDVVYITGDSGSGKSILLRQLTESISSLGEFGGVASSREPQEDEILVEGLGKDTREAVGILSMVGLNEAFLMLRRYGELSDGQKYRFRIAKAIDLGRGTWVFDEFCALLDRVTARVVAYCVQKAARRLGKTLIVATTHTDLFEDLAPSVYIVKKFGEDVEVHYRRGQSLGRHSCSLLEEIGIRLGSLRDFKMLEQFHYRGGHVFGRVYVASIRGEVVGGIVYTPPTWHRGRRRILPEYYESRDKRETWRLLNRDFTRIARVVVLPKYRSIGLGVRLVEETMSLIGKPYVETLAVMAKYNPFFEKAGMKPVHLDESNRRGEWAERLEALGFSPQLLSSKRYNMEVLRRLRREDLSKTVRILQGFPRLRRHEKLMARVRELDVEALAEALTKHPLNPLYLLWRNPLFKGHKDPFQVPSIEPAQPPLSQRKEAPSTLLGSPE